MRPSEPIVRSVLGCALAVLLFASGAAVAPATVGHAGERGKIRFAAGQAEENNTQLDLLPTPPRQQPGAHESATQQVGLPTWLKNAAAIPANLNGPLVAIVIDDAGLNRRGTKRAVELPVPVTMAYLAYAERLSDQVSEARRAGHEILLHMPMETLGDDTDTGPNALLTGLPRDELARRMKWNFERVEGYVGVNNHMGSRFTADRPGMTALMHELRERGLLFLDSRTTGSTVGKSVAREVGVPSLTRDIFLDNESTADSVKVQLDRAEKLARKNGYAVAIGHPREWTLEALEEWLPGAKARGVILVPLTTVLRSRYFASN